MLDSWSGARDLVYELALTDYALAVLTQSYMIGPTASAPFNVPRPIKIESAAIILTVGTPYLRFPLRIITEAEWAAIPDPTATGTIPDKLYVDPQVPNAVLNFHPVPLVSSTTRVELGTWNVVGQFATLSTSANLPPAYLRAITLGLEIEIAPTYGQVNPQILQQRQQQFAEAIQVVRDLNSKVQLTPLTPTATPPQQQQVPPQLLAALQQRGQ